MTRTIFYTLSLIGLFIFTACNNEETNLKGKGFLHLGVESDVTLQTKAYNTKIDVLVMDASEDTIKFISDFDSSKPEDILLDPGAYEVVVTSGSADTAAWNTPYFYGKEAFEIIANEVSVVKVVCKIANTKVTVEYSDTFKEFFTAYQTTVSNISGSLLYKQGETRSGFFAADKLTTLLELTNKDGQEFQLKRVFPDIKECYHYKLKFSLGEDIPGDDQAGGNFDITVDEKADTVFVRIPIAVEDLENLKVPEFKLTGFNENNVLNTKAGVAKPNKIELSVKAGVEQFTLSINSEQLNGLGLNNFNLMNLSDKERSQLEEIGFPIPDMSGSVFEFDLEVMSGKLLSYEESVQIHTFTFCVLDKKHQEQTSKITYETAPNRDVITKNVESVWATFAILRGGTEYVDELGFEYKEESSTEFTKVILNSDKVGDDFKCLIVGLKPNTTYVYRAVGTSPAGLEVYGNEVKFSTGFANLDANNKPFVPNLGFDDWYKDKKIWYPKAQGDDIFWDSGNEGASMMSKTPTQGTVITATGEGQAAELKSQYVGLGGSLGAFAAGNLYTGVFGETIGTSGAKINMGQPFTGRPTQFKGYYKYNSANITHTTLPAIAKGVSDSCHIYVALFSDWTGRFEVNTSEKKFVNLNEAIAFGEFCTDNSNSEYKEVVIDIKYRRTDKQPNYILIVMSASKYGDYFTGGEGSTLYIDEFKLEYDYNPASFIGNSLEGLTPANANK